MLSISQLSLTIDTKPIICNLSITIDPGTVHALMGPNGSGKSSLAMALMGHPAYTVTNGSIIWQGCDITALAPHERAQAGIFLAVQYPPAIPGVRIKHFLMEACRATLKEQFSTNQFETDFKEACMLLAIKPELCERGMHDGFSGGEKKRFELLQMCLLKPSFIMLDEIDSGLDIDALKLVGRVLSLVKQKNPDVSILIITHYRRILDYIIPDYVHVLNKGRIVTTGSQSLVAELEARGYDEYF